MSGKLKKGTAELSLNLSVFPFLLLFKRRKDFKEKNSERKRKKLKEGGKLNREKERKTKKTEKRKKVIRFWWKDLFTRSTVAYDRSREPCQKSHL